MRGTIIGVSKHALVSKYQNDPLIQENARKIVSECAVACTCN